jgi:isopenicillin-N epimerase
MDGGDQMAGHTGIDRRRFLTNSALVVGAGLADALPMGALDVRGPASIGAPPDWDVVRSQFDLDPNYRHLAAFVLAAHPAPVRAAIQAHRDGLDRNTHLYMIENEGSLTSDVTTAARSYLEASSESIAFTDSTTMGLGLLYGGMRFRPGDEVLTTQHDFYATHESLRLRSMRDGVRVRKIRLYDSLSSVTTSEIVSRIRNGITARTRVVALTWVHSSTGLKVPIARVARMIERLNAGRTRRERIILCVDGVHALGVEPEGVADLGCDFLVAGTHKWLWGPRGTGIVWGSSRGWARTRAVIPTFDGRSYQAWLDGVPPSETGLTPAAAMTPGGYHSFEHRWALAQAFDWHTEIGKQEIADRTHTLARRLKEGLSTMSHVTVRTPMSEDLSSGIVCFDVAGRDPGQVVNTLRTDHSIMASVSPYAVRHVRVGTSIVNSEQDVDATVAAIGSLSR